MCNCNSKDQTKKEVFDYIESLKLNILAVKDAPVGFGLFLVPAPELGVLETKTISVDDLTYKDTVKRGHLCLAFQWVPAGITAKARDGAEIKIEKPQDLLHILDCTSSRCSPSGCPMGCFCYSNETGNCHH